MEIEVNLDKKYLLIIFSTLFVFTTAFIVYAVDPSILGHPSSEISGFPNCSEGQSLTHNSTGWFCKTLSSGGSSFENLEVDTLNVTGKFYSGYEIVKTYSPASARAYNVYASCPAGKKLIGCQPYSPQNAISSEPLNNVTCHCLGELVDKYCYAICARIS